MPPTVPPGPFSLIDALAAYGDPAAVKDRKTIERITRHDVLQQHADFLLSEAEERSASQVHLVDGDAERSLRRSRERLVNTLLEQVRDEHIFLRGVPATMPEGSPDELIPNAWAMELELRFPDSSARRLTDRWLSVVVTTTLPRADELATSRRLVEASKQASVNHLPDGTFPLKQALLRLTDPDLAATFVAVEAELTLFRQIVTGRRPPGFEGVLIGLDQLGRDLQEHQLLDRMTRARSAIVTDFLTRLQDERILLTGLRTLPQLDASRMRLPPAWAPHMVFDWEAQAVRVFESVFVDVQGAARVPTQPRRPRLARTKAASARGRPRFPFDLLVEMVSSTSWKRAATNKEEAEALLAAYQKRHPNAKVPGYRTVLSHIGKIYAAAAKAAAAVKSRKSK